MSTKRGDRDPLHVVLHSRKKRPTGYFSIEKSFAAMRPHLPQSFHVEVATAPHDNHGFGHLFLNILAARKRRGDIHHVTGDIHYVALGLPRGKTIVTVHDCVYRTRMTGIRRALVEILWYRAPCATADVVTAVSEFTKSELVRHIGVPPEKIVVVPTCISPVLRRVDRAFDEQRPRILHIGTAPNKNLERLVAAIAALPCDLRVIGVLSRSQRRSLDQAGVVYSTATDLTEEELFAEYVGCDLVAFVSTFEGFGMPIVEGNTVGRPVVSSLAASMPEVAGSAACLVDPYDVASIRAGLLRVIHDRDYRAQLVAAGFENARRFAPAKVAEMYAAIYERMAAATSFQLGDVSDGRRPVTVARSAYRSDG